MRRILWLCCIILLTGVVFGQTPAWIPPQSVATSNDVFAIQRNPAGLAVNSGFQFGLTGTFRHSLQDTAGYFFSSGRDGHASGLGIYHYSGGYRYRYANSSELVRGSYFGFGIDFAKGYSPEYSLGLIFHPAKFVAIGGTAFNLTQSNDGKISYRAGLGLRPFDQRITFSGDAIFNYQPMSDSYETDWELILSARVVDGVTLNGFYRQAVNPLNTDKTFNSIGIGVGINLKHHSVQGAAEVSGDDGIYADGLGAYHLTEASMRSIFSPVRPDKYIYIELDGPIQEEKPPFSIFSRFRGRTVTEFTQKINRYSKRDDLAGLVIYVKNPSAGPAKYQEIRNALLRFRSTGKKIYVYMDQGGNSQYYLASAADKIIMNPAGQLWLTGISAQLMYVKELLAKVGVQANFVHIGKYKSAGDMFTQDSTTAANAEQLNAYLDDLYNMLTRDIAASRGLRQDSLKALINRGPFVPQDALKAGLIDSLMYHDEFKKFITGEKKFYHRELISEKRYDRLDDWQYAWQPPVTKKIAVIYAVGEIVPGKSSRSPFTGSVSMGAETIAGAIRTARKDNQVKAIVMRIDSPGGSSLASDIIWREVQLTTTGKNAKPFIVSMSDVAGSGGYYIAIAADTILADESTLTGSIGVIGGNFGLEDLFKKIGVNVDVLNRGDRANFLSVDHNMTPDERQKLFDMISDTYAIFVNKTAEGRDLPPDSVDALGRGRVYSGTDAAKVGLIDEVAGLNRALEIAQNAAGISAEDMQLEFYPKYQLGLFDMFDEPQVVADKLGLSDEMKSRLAKLEQLEMFSSQHGVYYLLPYVLEITD